MAELCAAICGAPRREFSKYCSARCRGRAAEKKRKARRAAGILPKQGSRWCAGDRVGNFELVRQYAAGLWVARCLRCKTTEVKAAPTTLHPGRVCAECTYALKRVEPECEFCGTTNPERFSNSRRACDACDRARYRNGVCETHGVILRKQIPGRKGRATCSACLATERTEKLDATVEGLSRVVRGLVESAEERAAKLRGELAALKSKEAHLAEIAEKVLKAASHLLEPARCLVCTGNARGGGFCDRHTRQLQKFGRIIPDGQAGIAARTPSAVPAPSVNGAAP